MEDKSLPTSPEHMLKLNCNLGGAGAYYFAKKEINANRIAKLEEQRKKRYMNLALEHESAARTDAVASPGQKSGSDPAPARHAPVTESQRVVEKSKYEAEPFISRKGDRFS